MKYPVSTAIGDAGEFFFAYKIASVLNWPCRLFDIDIGIDAQVEVMNEDRTSTGKFVAFQIKTTSIGERKCWYVTDRQLEYWRDLDLPVFVVLVDLESEQMYLHHISMDKSYHRVTRKDTVRIDFNLKQDRFSEKSGDVIAEAADKEALSHIQEHLDAIHEGIEDIRDAIATTADLGDAERLIQLMDGRVELREKLAQAEALVDVFCVGENKLKVTSDEMEDALEKLRCHMEEYNMHQDWDDDGRISKFIYEGRY